MNGILLADKPSGWTSNDVVCKMKGVLHERRIGHSGTLDPMATGLLPLFIGKATKAVEFAEKNIKKYIAGISFGIVTDTQDISGNIISEEQSSVTVQEFMKAADAEREKAVRPCKAGDRGRKKTQNSKYRIH